MSHNGVYRPGPGRPPREYQFKKGQSGNKKGRPRGRPNFKALLMQEFEAPITLAQNGETITILQALIKALIHKGLKGHMPALTSLLEHAQSCSQVEDLSSVELPEEDVVILRRLLGPRNDRD